LAKTNSQTIDEYHQTFSGETLKRLQCIRELINKIAPEAQEVISYQIPAFKLGERAYSIYYCAFEKHLTISHPWSEALLDKFKTELKDYKVSKSAIQLPLNKPLPMDLIQRILIFRKEEVATKSKGK
jgi:uncharacterized protein YdhG (YjbR/CyaY superfamily)